MSTVRLLAVGLAALASIANVAAQQPAVLIDVFLKDGRIISSPGIGRSGNSLMVTVSTGSGNGQVGYLVNTIARVAFSEPPQLKTARNLLARGKTAEAEGLAAQVMTYFAPYRDVPGNYWADAAALRWQALVGAGSEAAADKVVAEMLQSEEPETQNLARAAEGVRQARGGRYESAMVLFDEVIAKSTHPDTLAIAWLNKGRSLFAMNQWETALLAYLRVPVLYPQCTLSVPAALLDSAQALEAMDDVSEAEARLNLLLRDHPESLVAPQAVEALKRLKRKKS
jgi:tetratricopeptide (TPR) repeat protein